MRMPTLFEYVRTAAIFGVFSVAIALSGCSPTERKPGQGGAELPAPVTLPGPLFATNEPAKAAEKPEMKKPAKPAKVTPAATPTLEADPAEELEEQAKKPKDLGTPLVDKPERLFALHPKQPVWVDRENKQVVLLGEVCRADYPLEFFATYSNRSYEAVMAINVTPWIVHSGLLVVGAVPGHPVQFQPEFTPPSGTEVAIEVRWKDAEGKVQSAPAQHWIRNIQTKKELDSNWVFAGSILVDDDSTGKQQYLADSGELICTLNLPTAMLDLPIRSYAALESRLFEAFTEHLPPPGTPITVLLKPILSAEATEPAKPDAAAKPDATAKSEAAADPSAPSKESKPE